MSTAYFGAEQTSYHRVSGALPAELTHSGPHGLNPAPGRDVNIVKTLAEYVCSSYTRPWTPVRPPRPGSGPTRDWRGRDQGPTRAVAPHRRQTRLNPGPELLG
jgi:hypothetical protein